MPWWMDQVFVVGVIGYFVYLAWADRRRGSWERAERIARGEPY